MLNTKKLLAAKTREDGRAQIVVRFDVSRTNRPQLKTGIFIKTEFFDREKGTIIQVKKGKLNEDKFIECSEAQVALDSFCAKVSLIVTLSQKANIEVNRDWIMNVVEKENSGAVSHLDLESLVKLYQESHQTPKSEERPLYEYVESYISAHDLEADSIRNLRNVARILARYEMYQNMTGKPQFRLLLSIIDHDVLEDLRQFIATEKELSQQNTELFFTIFAKYPYSVDKVHMSKAIRARGSNYVKKALHTVGFVVKWLCESKDIKNPFHGFKVGKQAYGIPYYITLAERDHLANFDMSDQSWALQVQRDIFIFQTYVGCRVSDLYALTEANITNGVLEYIPKKTRKNPNAPRPRIPLMPFALELIDKYKTWRSTDPDGRLFPFVSEVCYNLRIKEAFKVAGLTRQIPVRDPLTGETVLKPLDQLATSHMARRTFAGNIYRAVKDPSIVCKMTGHTEGSVAFSRYRTIDDDVLMEAVVKGLDQSKPTNNTEPGSDPNSN